MNIKKKPLIILSTVIILILAVIYLATSFVGFRLIETSAKDGVIGTYDGTLVYTFNKPLSEDIDLSRNNITVEPAYKITSAKIQSDKLIFDLNEPSLGAELEISIKEIRSQDNNKITNINKSFVIKLGDSTAPEENSYTKILEKYPIVSILPIDTDEYTITYSIPDDENEKIRLNIVIKALEGKNLEEKASAADIDVYKKTINKAIADLEEKGFSSDSFIAPSPHSF